MKHFKFKIRGSEYEVHLSNFENNIAELEVNGTAYKVELEKEVKKSKTPKLVRPAVAAPTRREQKLPKNISSKAFAIKAPLPGVIIEIKVKPGDTVKKGDVLLIMEAMKMENNILAEKDGKIKTVKVNNGDNVLQDDVLIEIE